MNIRKTLIKLAKKFESRWHSVDFDQTPIQIKAGWYLSEFKLQGSVTQTPKIIVDTASGTVVKKIAKNTEASNADTHFERALIGSHSGRNRTMVYLPAGRLVAVSESIEFDFLSRIPWWEGRARILLICFRYLLDFFSLKTLLTMVLMQFKNPYDLSTDLLFFYRPYDPSAYLDGLKVWDGWHRYQKLLTWYYRDIKVAVLIEDDSQRVHLNALLVTPDVVWNVNEITEFTEKVDYVIVLAQSEELRSPAIIIIKQAIKKARRDKLKPELIYTDHDYAISPEQGGIAREPVFKPNPSAAYLHCFNYIGQSVVFSQASLDGKDLLDLFDEKKLYYFSLSIFADLKRVLHVDEALFMSLRNTALRTPQPNTNASFWQDIQWQTQGEHNALLASTDWVQKPSVDLIIPTRDGLDVLKPCIESILSITDYPNYQIIIVDNGSEQSATHDFLHKVSQDPRVNVVDYPGEFNYSAINNYAAAQGDGDYVALINNDIEVIHADWLTQMMVWVKQPNVGIVGAKLLFGNGLVQHAGVTIGMGNAAGHIHRLEAGDSAGYQQRCLATQNMMAVTAACLVTPRALFEQLRGLDAEHFKVAYNDIDYCLRVEKLGLDIIWTPQARLYHHESVSRGDDMSDEHIERYFYELGVLQKRWKTKGFVDKYYNKHLRIGDEGVYPQLLGKGDELLRTF